MKMLETHVYIWVSSAGNCATLSPTHQKLVQ